MITARRQQARLACAALVAILIAICATYVMPATAQVASNPAPLQFNSTEEEQRFHALIEDLRCVMCQNQSLADSNAQIALDLRREILGLMRDGRSDADIEAFLVARYGEFVLYRPRMQGANWLLWLAPLLFVVAGGWMLTKLLRGQRQQTPSARIAHNEDDGQAW